MVESVAYYECEVSILMREEQRKFLALKMDCLRRLAKVSRVIKIEPHH
jgi:hypothetical protein